MVAISASVQSGERESRHRRTAQIVKREADDASAFASLAPRRPKPSDVQGLAVARALRECETRPSLRPLNDLASDRVEFRIGTTHINTRQNECRYNDKQADRNADRGHT